MRPSLTHTWKRSATTCPMFSSGVINVSGPVPGPCFEETDAVLMMPETTGCFVVSEAR